MRCPGRELCPDGPLEVGATVRLPGIARTLRAVARDGRAGFYGGEFGAGLLELGAGHFSPGDLDADAAQWREPLALSVVGPPTLDGAPALAGLSHLGRRGGGRAGRARHRPRRPGVGRTCWSRPGAPLGTTGPTRSTTAPTVGAAATTNGCPGGGAGRGRPGRPAGRRRPVDGAGARVARFGDGDTTHLCACDADGLGVSLTQSNALDFGSHLVEPATGVFLHNRGVGLLAGRGTPGRGGAGPAPAAHAVPDVGDRAGRRADASRRRDGRRRPAADHQPAVGPPAAHRPGPGHRHQRAPAGARRTGRRALPAVVGRRPQGPRRGRRARRRGARDSRPGGMCPRHQRVRPGRRRLRADHRRRARRRRRSWPGRRLGPAQPRRRGAWADERPGAGARTHRARRCASRRWPSRSPTPSRCAWRAGGSSGPASSSR